MNKEYWEDRAKNIKEHNGEEFYTITEIPFYVYRRERILNVLDKVDLKGKRILDLGCGDGYYSIYLNKRGADVVGVDLSSNMVKLAKKNAKKNGLEIPFYEIDGNKLNFSDEYFDMVLTVVVLQHVIGEFELNKLIKEVRRVLTKCGIVIIFEAISKRQGTSNTWTSRHPEEYIEIFKRYGLSLTSKSVISSPFYNYMMYPYTLLMRKYGITSLNKVNPIYSIYPKFLVFITKHLDNIWQSNRRGLGFYMFSKNDGKC